MANSVIKTYNFSLSENKAYLGESNVTIKDKRNNIISENTEPMISLQPYINYLETLQTLSNRWTNYGYFDLGMVPLAMAPSTVHSHIATFISIYCVERGITYYELPGVSLLPGGFAVGMKDIWVFREELCREIGYSGNPLSFSVIDYIKGDVSKAWREKIEAGTLTDIN